MGGRGVVKIFIAEASSHYHKPGDVSTIPQQASKQEGGEARSKLGYYRSGTLEVVERPFLLDQLVHTLPNVHAASCYIHIYNNKKNNKKCLDYFVNSTQEMVLYIILK